MRMVNPDTTVHLVLVTPYDLQTGAWYVIENHGDETGDCLLEPFLEGQMNLSHPPGLYQVTGKTSRIGRGTEWQRADTWQQPDVGALARRGFTVDSVPFTFPIPLDKRRRVQSAAAEQGITPNDWVMQAIDDKLTKGLGE